MTEDTKTAALEGLNLYEASIKRMQKSKPQFSSVFEIELRTVRAAQTEITALAVTK